MMKLDFRRCLSRRVDVDAAIVLFSIALVAVIWTLFVLDARSERGEAVVTALKQNSNLAVAYDEHIVRTIKGLDAVIRFVRYEYGRAGARMSISRYIADGAIDGRLFSILSVVNENGDIVVSSSPAASVNYADRDHFRIHRERDTDELYISKPVLGRVSHTWQIPMTRRIRKPDGSFGGVVVLSVDPSYFTDFYQKADLGENGLVMLVGLDGTARARRVGRVVSFGNDMSQSALVRAHRSERAGSYFDEGYVEGVARHVSYRTLSDYPLIVAVGTAEDEVLADARRHRARNYAAATLITVVIGLFCALLLVATARQRRASAALAITETRFRATFEQAAIGIAHIALDGRYVAVNRKFCDMLGRTPEELVGAPAGEIEKGGEDDAHMTALLTGKIDAHAAEQKYESPGKVAWGNSTVTLVRDDAGAPMYFLRVIEDITERKRLEANLTELATTDMLTGLPNRRHFVVRLEEEHARLQRFDTQYAALLLLDLDYFKRINDTYGHAAGDAVLKHFAALLRTGIRKIDVPARVGGEEFAIILPGATRTAALELAERLRRTVAGTPAVYDGASIPFTVSIGIAAMDRADAQAGAALVRADAALYRAKASGRD
ncbi:MAG TPA: diguanylate cyclase, partial [Burkholderiales bacterium]|nr:diguanylate cyclase [Burkholderiales bacterium]